VAATRYAAASCNFVIIGTQYKYGSITGVDHAPACRESYVRQQTIAWSENALFSEQLQPYVAAFAAAPVSGFTLAVL
jgi:hypothetical protein